MQGQSQLAKPDSLAELNPQLMKKIILLFGLFLLCMPYRVLIADDALSARLPIVPLIKPLERTTMPLQAFIDEYSIKYHVSPKDLYKVLYCESHFNEKAVGDGGLARNVAQFHKSTFEMWEKDFGEDLNYDSAQDQIKLMAWAFSKGYQHHWTCAKITGVVK